MNLIYRYRFLINGNSVKIFDYLRDIKNASSLFDHIIKVEELNELEYIEYCRSIVPFIKKTVGLSVVNDDGCSNFLVKTNDKLIRNFMQFELFEINQERSEVEVSLLTGHEKI